MKNRTLLGWAVLMTALFVWNTNADIFYGGFDAYGPPCWPESQGGKEGDGGSIGSNGKSSGFSDPIWIPHGEYLERHTDIKLPGRGLNIEFVRSYRSRSQLQALPGSEGASLREEAPLGLGWSHNYNQRVFPATTTTTTTTTTTQATIYTGDERISSFTRIFSFSGIGDQYTTLGVSDWSEIPINQINECHFVLNTAVLQTGGR